MHAWRSIKYGAAVPSFARITCVNEELGAAVGFKLGRDAKFLSNKMLHMSEIDKSSGRHSLLSISDNTWISLA